MCLSENVLTPVLLFAVHRVCEWKNKTGHYLCVRYWLVHWSSIFFQTLVQALLPGARKRLKNAEKGKAGKEEELQTGLQVGYRACVHVHRSLLYYMSF
jgi:hypothetical protein